MKTTKTFTIAAIALALTAGIASCSTDTAPEPAASSATTADAVEPVAEPATAPDPAPAPLTAASPAGTEVPADRVEELRAAGAHVYVPYSGGTAMIIEAGTIPQVIIDDALTSMAAVPAASRAIAMGFVREQVEAAGASAFFLYTGTNPRTNELLYGVTSVGAVGDRKSTRLNSSHWE